MKCHSRNIGQTTSEDVPSGPAYLPERTWRGTAVFRDDLLWDYAGVTDFILLQNILIKVQATDQNRSTNRLGPCHNFG